MKRLIRKIHLWLSIPFGMIILVMCLSGALLSFERELSGLYVSDRLSVNQASSATMMEQAHGRTVEAKGKVEKRNRPLRTPFFMAVFRLHRWLMIDSPREVPFSWGRAVTGVTTIAFILILLSGVWLWWPHTRQGWVKSFSIETRKGGYRLMRSLHICLGVCTVAVLLVMALTGLYWTFSIGGIDKRLMLELHTGRWGGIFMRLVYCLSAIVGAVLVVSGYWLWWAKRKIPTNRYCNKP